MILILYGPSMCIGEWIKIPMVLGRNWTQNDKCFPISFKVVLELSHGSQNFTHYFTKSDNPTVRYRNKYCFLYDANFTHKKDRENGDDERHAHTEGGLHWISDKY